jgi:hypothetical protein
MRYLAAALGSFPSMIIALSLLFTSMLSGTLYYAKQNEKNTNTMVVEDEEQTK